ncbi:nicotinate-nucleotide adenylyltransferase [Fructilactobacillus sanfranciscensis]|uniref:Probable nicotinate-nucleotide adenylyltransferase n=1 Tax=Fructilactobacillus sanfranciscensis TaxID=1625 RepID=A0A5C4TKG3_FRUSA|nr:nicotinate-nucleotide adenylyltransferase [Fructilactobacillus sanfranciscensis]POH15557.1 nicotinate-nucleotide adenylyltransferase [Fructilactobacillus sanfranciscensis]TNK90998.1 nicotinate-nucleotide adenylyltransferase [Fructilactobacillus sanfranciscensis]TNK96228.1 nicotinate-nucleotide adenylyltransferase [Fructilactobacillus sanfranciscensis]TNK99869.1 nicotinate-nucleotide adenylyltransferase [Fructilactobacillus sanfranciscensis]TNL01134.1 nicotinate-nucleotide adenylyltransferas
MEQKKIGILGGTFNPIHLGHLIMAEQALSQLKLDKVLFMPDYLPPHIDHKDTIDAFDRINMIKLAIANNSNFKLETIEVDRGGKSYSFDTMVQLTKNHPNNDYYFIIGGDMVEYLPKWYRINDLLKMVTFVGVKRLGNKAETEYPVKWISSPLIDISSTYVRNSILHHRDLRYLVPNQVLNYIKENGLYE